MATICESDDESTDFGEPGREILGVIRAGLVGDAEIGAEEGGSEFGDQLLDRIGLVAEALAELPMAAALGAGPGQSS